MQFKINKNIFCLDLSNSISYKKKKRLIDCLVSHGGIISYVLNKRVNYVIKDEKNDSSLDSYKCRQAFKLRIPIIHLEFFNDYYLNLNSNCDANDTIKPVLSFEDYLITNKRSLVNGFQKGKIAKCKSKRETCLNTIEINFMFKAQANEENEEKIDLNKLEKYSIHDQLNENFENILYNVIKWSIFNVIFIYLILN
jgi:hypothetical protein